MVIISHLVKHLPIGAKVVRQIILLHKFGKVSNPESGAADSHVALTHLLQEKILIIHYLLN